MQKHTEYIILFGQWK